jgi:NMD protein affecting ribosome stability and mRNA decay
VAIEIQPIIVRLRERRCPECARFWACEFEFHGMCPICAAARLEQVEKKLSKLEVDLRVLQSSRDSALAKLARKRKREKT